MTEGFQVNVAMLPAGDDPDNFIRRQGAAAYQEQLRNSRQYLEYLLDRSAADEDLSTDEGRRSFLGKMLAVAARIPDAAQRDQFADRLSHKARITEEVVRAEIRKAAVQRQTNVDEVQRRVPALGQVKAAERGLIWALMHQPDGARDGPGRAGRRRSGGAGDPGDPAAGAIPAGMARRVITGGPDRASKYRRGRLVEEIARQTGAPADAADCVRTLKRLRYDRERAELQREIDRLQERARPATTTRSSRSGSARKICSSGSIRQ